MNMGNKLPEHPECVTPQSDSMASSELQQVLAKALRRKRCAECNDWADTPSKLCPGCEAYREHTGHI